MTDAEALAALRQIVSETVAQLLEVRAGFGRTVAPDEEVLSEVNEGGLHPKLASDNLNELLVESVRTLSELVLAAELRGEARRLEEV